MRARRFHCPVCGSMAWDKGLDSYHEIDTFMMFSRGKGHGFRFEKVNDLGLVTKIKNKVRIVYRQIFLGKLPIRVDLFPYSYASITPSVKVTSITPSVKISMGVKII